MPPNEPNARHRHAPGMAAEQAAVSALERLGREPDAAHAALTAAFASAMISAGAETEVAATSFRNMGLALTHGTALINHEETCRRFDAAMIERDRGMR